jgi:Putative zinc-finger
MSCEQVRQLAPELALGIADGAERAAALRHLAECPACRRVVEDLSEVTDELLMLAPEREPPAGFESRVLARIRPPQPLTLKPRRRRSLVAALAGAVTAAAVTAVLMLNAYDDERRIAAHYRATLAQAHGSYFEAATLRSASGARAGVVFAYRGTPSWIFVVVERPFRATASGGELVLDGGRRVPLPSLRIDPARGSAGQALPVDLHDVAVVRLGSGSGADALTARLPHARDR